MAANGTITDGHAVKRPIRFGLVMNGGVSLAVWIGGVTVELDHLRIASSWPEDRLEGTEPAYARLLAILDQSVEIDVIAGASAGGINGILLGAAIANGKRLPNLRETWIRVGDFRGLLRTPSKKDPPSLMKGDEVVLAEIRAKIEELYRGDPEPDQDHLYLYVTATDLRGFVREFRDSADRAFDERDYRRTLSFSFDSSSGAAAAGEGPPGDRTFPAAGSAVDLIADGGACTLLSEAARSTSSFPVAFEPHQAFFQGDGDERTRHWLIDGGMLDNQPFNPVLDRIAVLPGGEPVKRVVAYVVPYVNEPGSLLEEDPGGSDPTAKELIAASGKLPRELPKLQGLDRVISQSSVQQRAEDDRRRTWAADPAGLEGAAGQLFELYRRTRLIASYDLFGQWASPSFRPGDGVYAQDPALEPESAMERLRCRPPELEDPSGLPWIPRTLAWREAERWTWGLAPAERVASWALLFLRDPLTDPCHRGAEEVSPDVRKGIVEAREHASQIVRLARDTKRALFEAYRQVRGVQESMQRQREQLRVEESRRHDLRPTEWELRGWATEAYEKIEEALAELYSQLSTLELRIAALNQALAPHEPLPQVQDLLHLEVVRNASAIETVAVPFPFDFLFMSAGIENSLGHGSRSPAQKLAGIKLGHFAGFLKRSWRANDWLWGRMDGVEHILRALLDADAVSTLSDEQISDLAEFAFPEAADEPGLSTLLDLARASLRDEAIAAFVGTLTEVRAGLQVQDAAFAAAREREISAGDFLPYLEEANISIRDDLERCRKALAARVQLAVLQDEDDELARVATTVEEDSRAGASRISRGAMWMSRFDGVRDASPGGLDANQRVALFRELDIGREDPQDDISSRLVMDVGAQAVAVAAALAAGERGGLPLPARTALATLRGLTLTIGGVVRLLAREPLIGAAVVFVLAGLMVWGFVDGAVIVGSLAPGLAVVVAVAAIVLLTIATSMFEESLGHLGRAAGFAVLLGVPLAFGLLAGWPGHEVTHDWLSAHAHWFVTYVAAVAGFVAAASAAARFTVGAKRPPPTTSFWLEFASLAAVAVALGVFAGVALGGSWLEGWTDDDYARVTIGAAFGIATAAAARALIQIWRLIPGDGLSRLLDVPLGWRHGTIGFYRLALVSGVVTLLGGFLAMRWVHAGVSAGWQKVADENKGIVLVGVLFAVVTLAAIVIEILPRRGE